MNRRIILIALAIIVITPLFVTMLALQNQPWTHSPVVRKTQAFISTIILSHFDVVTIPGNQNPLPNPDLPLARIAPHKYRALRSRNITILTTNEVMSKKSSEYNTRIKSKDSFIIAVIETLDLLGKTQTEKRKIIEKVDDLALKRKIDAIVEATASDNVSNNIWGLKRTGRLHKAGVIRCVIFDGGHHIGPLELAPDILLVPVTRHKKALYASHWFTRDSIPVWKLERLLKDENMDCLVALFPRDGLPVKNSKGMAMIALQAILKIMEELGDGKSTPNYKPATQLKQTPQQQQNHNNSSSKTKPIFISLKVSPKDDETTILKKLKNKIKSKQKDEEKIDRVYVGLTFGISQFPYKSERIKIKTSRLETSLSKNLPHKITVLSEPLSTWDIYLARLGIH